MQEKSLESLILESQNGNKDAFREIFEELSNRLFIYALSHTKNRDDALDITQDTFIDIYSALKKFHYNCDEAFYGFVFTILKRKLVKHYKRSARDASIEIESMEESWEMEIEDHRYLLKHIEMLSKKYQDVLKLRYWSDLTFKEISSTLGVKEATAKVWHHRAIHKLKINLENYNHV